MTTAKPIRRLIIALFGGTVLALGIALIVLPGPAFLVIPAGLAILAVEFAWARRWLRSARAILPKHSRDASAHGKKSPCNQSGAARVFCCVKSAGP